MAWAADEAFNGQSDDERIEKFFAGVFGTSYRRQLLASDLTITVRDTDMSPEAAKRHGPPPWRLHAPCALWDDPLMGIVWNEYKAFNSKVWENYAADLQVLREKLSPYRISDHSAGYIDHAWHCANALLLKVELRLQLLEAYKKRDRQTLAAIQGAKIDAVISALDGLNDSFRRQWLRSYKYYGLEVMQIKLAGLKERYRETSRRIGELLAGEIDSIPELDANPVTLGSTDTRYRMAATGSCFI